MWVPITKHASLGQHLAQPALTHLQPNVLLEGQTVTASDICRPASYQARLGAISWITCTMHVGPIFDHLYHVCETHLNLIFQLPSFLTGGRLRVWHLMPPSMIKLLWEKGTWIDIDINACRQWLCNCQNGFILLILTSHAFFMQWSLMPANIQDSHPFYTAS